MNSDTESLPALPEKNYTIDESVPLLLNNLDDFNVPIVAATESVTSNDYDNVYDACLNDVTVTTPGSPFAANRPMTEGMYCDAIMYK